MTAGSTPLPLDHGSFAVIGPLAPVGSAFYPVLVHRPAASLHASSPQSVALMQLRFARCDQLTMGLAPIRGRPCWAPHKENGPPSGPFLLVTYRCCLFGRAALWDFYHPCRGPGSAGPVSDRRLVADRASDPVDSAGRVDFGSSCCFLSWEHRDNRSESASFRKNKSGNLHRHHYVTLSLTYSVLRSSLIGCATS
jgi:hypothetical protein